MRRAGNNPVAGRHADELMRCAIEASRSTFPHPNPRVGAVITSSDGTVLSVAAHQSAGQPHAEVLALNAVEDAVGTSLYVTLEPCNHHGRTAPCTQAIMDAGVSRVVVGITDPDSRVSGRGIERLREAGLEVTVGVLSAEVVANDPGYFHQRANGVPIVTVKIATTLDGQAAAKDGTSQWITSREAREDAHRLRSQNDAVIVGVGTVIADDPTLTVRLDDYSGPQPRPVVIAGAREIPSDRQILLRDPIIYRPVGASTVDPATVVEDLGERDIVSAMVEGGPTLIASFLRAEVVDQIVWYVGAKLGVGTGIPALAGVFDTMANITQISIANVERIGPDIKISATMDKER